MLFTLNDSRVIARIPSVNQTLLAYSTSTKRNDVTTDSFDNIVTPLFTTSFSPNLVISTIKQHRQLGFCLEEPTLQVYNIVIKNRRGDF